MHSYFPIFFVSKTIYLVYFYKYRNGIIGIKKLYKFEISLADNVPVFFV